MTTRVVPYEILFRLNQAGEVVGCHRRDLKVVIDGADTFTKELDPVHIEGPEMDAVLGVINTALTATLDERNEEIISLKNSINYAEVLNSELKAKIGFLERANDEASYRLAELLAKNEE